MKKISVILLCHNNYGINICIKAILHQLMLGDEIVIVNDHSDTSFIDNELAYFLEDERIHLYSVSEKTGNRSHNRNFGAKKSQNDILIFLDGDMIISDETLEAFRSIHENEEYVAALGNAHGMRFSKEHMALHIGREDYLQLVQTKEGLQQLIENPALQDWRLSQFCQPELEPYYWIYYYTCICSVERKLFLRIEGFDEALVTWGSEDIDLGYRLSLYGRIGYAVHAHAVHIPHKRNLWDEQLFDRDNIRYLLDKHRAWPFEMLLSLEFSCDCYELIQQIYNDITDWDLSRLTPCPIKNSIWINTPSPSHISDTIVVFNHILEQESMGLIGVSIPYCDQRFDIAYISANIFSYPMEITAKIMQECMRISQQVIIVPTQTSKRKFWDKSDILKTAEIYRTYYVSSDTMEYEFIPREDNCYQVCSPQIKNWFRASRSHCPIHVSAHSRKVWHEKLVPAEQKLLLINLIEQDTDEICCKLENALGVTFIQQYHFSVECEKVFSLTENFPIGLYNSKYSLFFVVYIREQLAAKSLKHWLKIRQIPDFVLSLDGCIDRL